MNRKESSKKEHMCKTMEVFTIVVEHYVLWFQVSVDDSLLMQMTQCHGNLCQVETYKQNKDLVRQ